MSRHAHVDPVFAALLDALAPDNLRFPQVTPPRDPFASDETPDPDAPGVAPSEDAE